MDRGRRRRPAGFRTYLIVCVAAALTMILSQYEYEMLLTDWADIAKEVGLKTDVSRFGAQVVNGIGFLGAGTVIATQSQSVKGLTTAAGLWASACMGLAAGAGFYECVLLGFLLILLSVGPLRSIEEIISARSRNINLYVEFHAMSDVGNIVKELKARDVEIFDMDIDRGHETNFQSPNAVFYLHLSTSKDHHDVLAAISEIPDVIRVKEI